MRQLGEFIQRIVVILKYVASYWLNHMFRATVWYTKENKKTILRDNWVLFEAYRGEKMADTPYAMFIAMLEDERYKDFTYIWTVNEKDNYYAKLYKHNPQVRICKRHSKQYVTALCEAKYVINNKAFPYYFVKKEGQIHASTWHATAFKALGKDQGGTMGQFKNVTRNYVQTDYLIMPNKFTSNIMLASNDVKGIFPGYVVEEGYPRNDLTINTKREDVMKLLKSCFEVDESKKIVMYAPTWRGETGNSTDITKDLLANVKKIEKQLGQEYELLLKVHDLTAQFIKKSDEKYDFRIVPDWIDSNEVLNAVDILITDYSSIFIDFMVLNRPVVFYTYDLEEYIKDRGLYFNMNEMPGPNCATVKEVVAAIKQADDFMIQYKDLYQQMKEEFCGRDDGKASKRVNDIIFQGKVSQNMYRSNESNQKKRILIMSDLDDFSQENQQIVEFSNQLDYEHYDLTVLLVGKVNRNRTYVLRSLHKEARVFYSMGIWNQTFKEYYIQKKMSKACVKDRIVLLNKSSQVFRTQYKRLVGTIQYDIGIVFGQRMTTSMGLMLKSDIKKKVLCLVNEVPDEKNASNQYLISEFDKVITMDTMFYKGLKNSAKKMDQLSKLVKVKKMVNLSMPLVMVMERAKTELAFFDQAFETMLQTKAISTKQRNTSRDAKGNTLQQFKNLENNLAAVLNEVEEEHKKEVDLFNKKIMSKFYTIMNEENVNED